MPASAPIMTATSTHVLGDTAEMIPSGTPSAMAIARPAMASAADAGRLSMISVMAGCPVTTELPRSPVKALLHEQTDIAGRPADRGRVRPQHGERLLGRVVAQHVLRGVAGHRPHKEEGDGDDPEQSDDELNEATTEIVEHVVPFLRERYRVGLHRKQRVLHEPFHGVACAP